MQSLVFVPNSTIGSVPDGCEKGISAGKASTVFFEVFTLLIFSHLFHLVLHRFGQPSVISQILAGIVMGQTGLNRWLHGRTALDTARDNSYISSVGNVGRIFFMFLVGLEIDIQYVRRMSRRAIIVASGGAAACAVAALATTPALYSLTGAGGGRVRFGAALVLILANTASPILIRMAAELKLAASEVGRLVISAALVNDMACLLLVALVGSAPANYEGPWSGMSGKALGSWDGKRESWDGQRVKHCLFALALIASAAGAVRPIVWWLNRRSRHRRRISAAGVVFLMIFILVTAICTEVVGYNSMMACFILGLVFPRDGAAARTLMGFLTYPVYNIVLPIYFSTTGIQTDLNVLQDHKIALSVFILVLLGTAGKVGGTILATNYLNIPFKEGLVVGFLLNVKGHVDLIVVSMARKQGIFGNRAYTMLLITVIVSTLTAGPAAAFIVRRERKARRSPSMGLQWLSLDRELRVLGCVNGYRDVPTMLDIVEMSNGSERTPLAAYLMHLVQLTPTITTTMLYHQLEDGHFDRANAGEDARQINAAVDVFARDAGIALRQLTAISAFATMHEDVCNAAADIRASLVVVPFHKRQRIDGRMGVGKDGIRGMNVKVLRQAPCTAGILVDRGMNAAAVSNGGGGETLHHVAVLFFGGPDDREAVAYGGRLAMNACISVTVVRFLPASGNDDGGGEIKRRASRESEVLLSIDNKRMESYADEEFMSDFYNRFVAQGMVTYVERLVDNGAETVAALSSMEGMFSLFIVGKEGRRLSPLTTGLTEWQECPELGPIGDLLASSDFITGSVLVLQQHHLSKTRDKSDDEFTL